MTATTARPILGKKKRPRSAHCGNGQLGSPTSFDGGTASDDNKLGIRARTRVYAFSPERTGSYLGQDEEAPTATTAAAAAAGETCCRHHNRNQHRCHRGSTGTGGESRTRRVAFEFERNGEGKRGGGGGSFLCGGGGVGLGSAQEMPGTLCHPDGRCYCDDGYCDRDCGRCCDPKSRRPLPAEGSTEAQGATESLEQHLGVVDISKVRLARIHTYVLSDLYTYILFFF